VSGGRVMRLLVAAWLGMACARPDRAATVSTGQAIIELSDAINDVRQENATLQEQIDSLRTAVARQDTLVTRLAGLVGVPLAPR
jgi:septal ring factor EnvC (AmiA/AmiB activator)